MADLVLDMLNGVLDNNTKVKDLTIEIMESIPTDANPFQFDLYNMGERKGSNLTLMYGNHDTEVCRYLILVHKDGRRWKVRIPD